MGWRIPLHHLLRLDPDPWVEAWLKEMEELPTWDLDSWGSATQTPESMSSYTERAVSTVSLAT